MMLSFDTVTVVTVTYNSITIVPQLAHTLNRFTHIVVVDNASQDGTAEAISKHIPHAHVICNTTNRGFGTANNQAVALAKTPYVLLLNPDCDISTDALTHLLSTAALYPSAALIAPQGWHDSKRPQPSYRQAFYEKQIAQPYRIPDATCSAKWLHGCCLLVRVEAFRQFGGFDERFFLYYEDDDLCLRALQAGYDCLLEPHAQILHLGGASSTPSWRVEFRKHFYFSRSRYRIIDKYQGKTMALRYRIKTALISIPAILLYSILLQRRHALKWLAWGCSAWKIL